MKYGGDGFLGSDSQLSLKPGFDPFQAHDLCHVFLTSLRLISLIGKKRIIKTFLIGGVKKERRKSFSYKQDQGASKLTTSLSTWPEP